MLPISKWHCSLGSRFHDARGFYLIIIVSTLFGIAIDWSSLDPIKALFWSAVLNGMIAVPLLVVIMILAGNRSIMGDYSTSPFLRFLGWSTAALMAAAVAAMLIL